MRPSEPSAAPDPVGALSTQRGPGHLLGRETGFRLEPVADPVFDRRLVLPELRGGGWIVLTYRDAPGARPLRPMLRLLRGGGRVQDFVLPGVAAARAHWLGLVPADTAEIRLAAGPGFVLERAGRRGEAGLLLQALGTRPLRALSALYERLRGDERRYRDTLRGVCAVTPLAGYVEWAAARGGAEAALPPPSAGEGGPRVSEGRERGATAQNERGAIRSAPSLPSSPPRRGVPSPAEGGGEGVSFGTGEAHNSGAIHILVLADTDNLGLDATLASLRAQTHPAWHATVLHTADPLPASGDPRIAHEPWRDDRPLRDLARGPLCLLAAGDRLASDALALLDGALAGADLAYADERRDCAPRLKPDWSPDLARVTGYVGRPWLASPALLDRLDGSAGPIGTFALALEPWLAAAARVAHLPRVLADTVGPDPDAAARAKTLARSAAPRSAAPRSGGEPVLRDGVLDLRWPLPEPPPLASIVIPSRDRLDLIERVCRGVLHETAYPAIDCVIVDNGSTDPAVLAHYDELRRDPRVRIVPYPAPFNFSAMVNAGVAAATGTVVVLLNNDVAVLEPGWLDALVRQAVRPGIGAVGAKLLYADGRLQHAGVVVGLGGRAGHILRRRPGDSPGHLGRMRVAHEVSAVTAACLGVSRENYLAVGGFDADAFPVDFNDVDFCLRLGARGLRTMWTPAATLAHLESVSRGPSVGAKRARFEAEAERFTERWRDVIRHDPFYHPALSLTTFGEDLE